MSKPPYNILHIQTLLSDYTMTTPPPILSVSQLNRQVRSWLEHEVGLVSVEGEMSNLSKPASGHYYFTLKDANAQIRCVFFKNRHDPKENSNLSNGQQIIATGSLSLYEARGDYQLIVDQLRESGIGDLFYQFELLKTKLTALGLFESERKRALPCFPAVIGIITSASGAALRDILSTLARRYPVASVIVYSSEVQGKQAAQQLIDAITRANIENRCNVLILARGGGSIEDLWAFNNEQLAHTIANSLIPTISGVGHETDFTIADFVADLRAATPTAAAEAASPNIHEVLLTFQTLENRLTNAINRQIQHQKLLLLHEVEKMASPKKLINTHWQSLDHLSSRLHHAFHQLLTQKYQLLHNSMTQLEAQNPNVLLEQAKSSLQQLENALHTHIHVKINQIRQKFATQLATLHAVSPLATLERGYAIATHNNKVILDSHSINTGNVINVQLAKGRLKAKVIA